MSISFKILWFDDQSIDAHQRIIERLLMDKYCLKLEVNKKIGNENLENIEYNRFDLILMDYALINSESGVEKYKLIRQKHSYVDVAFYSTKVSALREDIKKLEEDGYDVEGVFYLEYNDTLFKEKIDRIINKIVKRSESIENIRGLVLQETARFDSRATSIMLNLAEKYNIKNELSFYIDASLHEGLLQTAQKKEKNYRDAEDKFEFCINFSNQIPYLDSYSRIRLLTHALKICKKRGINISSELDSFCENYQKEIIVYRNAFAHKRENLNKIVVNEKEIFIDDNFFKFMRNILHKYEHLFDLIEKV